MAYFAFAAVTRDGCVELLGPFDVFGNDFEQAYLEQVDAMVHELASGARLGHLGSRVELQEHGIWFDLKLFTVQDIMNAEPILPRVPF